MNTDIRATVDTITNKQAEGLNIQLVKQIKAFCKVGDANVEIVFQLLWSKLNENHSQVR